MPQTVTLDPLTRIEGHLSFRVETEAGRVKQAFVAGEMFRGFETILRGRDPMDAQQITQRICGVCPVDHGVASTLAQEMAYGVQPPENGRLIRNLIQGANYIHSHISHFYLLSALDYLDVTAITGYKGKDSALTCLKDWVLAEVASKSIYPAAPLLARYTANYAADVDLNIGGLKHYLDAFEMRAAAHRLGAVFAGKLPHAATLVPGGVTETVTADKIAACQGLLPRLQQFIDNAYLPDVAALASAFPDYFAQGRGCGNFLCYGGFPESGDGRAKVFPAGVLLGGQLAELDPNAVTEDVLYSRYSSASGLKPAAGQTDASPQKQGAYSWLKAPRYQGAVVETGPLARVLVACARGQNPAFNSQVESSLKALGKSMPDLDSVTGRHLARALECKMIADRCATWLEQLVPGQPACVPAVIPAAGQGFGLTEAARGALGHWLEIRDRKISNYQCVVPTTWNCSPRDDRGQPGAVEQALVGTPLADPNNPIETARVVRSFDPCIACAVH
jgi:ferredoxin hydrogenase large subunit/hydrogenase large subunit